MMETSTVRNQLDAFLNHHLPEITLSSIDEVLLEYIVNVLEQFGDDESFDLDGFMEMMAAYIPGFETIDSELVWNWMIEIGTIVNEKKNEGKNHFIGDNVKEPMSSCCEKLLDRDNGKSCTEVTEKAALKDEAPDVSFDKKIQQLSELFPGACPLEIKKCLLVANGDPEEAASLMLSSNSGDHSHEPEAVNVLDFEAKEHCPSANRQDLGYKDKQNLKEFVTNRYLYVDVEDDKKTHKPVAAVKSVEPKKMIRYLNNQVVSTKGERYTQIKRQESEDMKKTYVNLKPARKYRFH